MQKYADWNQTRLYSDHLERLKSIRSKRFKKIPKQLSISYHNQSSPIRNNVQTHRSNKQNSQASYFIPLPLVSQKQRKMLGQAIKGNDMTLQQKQLLLENYLLGKRIVETESVLKSSQLKKEYKFHLKVSKNMSRSLKSNRMLTEMRGQKFRQFEKQDVINTIKPSKGNGNFQLQLKITQICLIKGKIDSNQEVLYNIFFLNKLGNEVGYRAIDLNQILNEKLKFNFGKKDLFNGEMLQLTIEMIRKNQLVLIGMFQVSIEQQLISAQYRKTQQKQKRIESLFRQQPETATNINSKKVITVGTIQFSLFLRRRHFRMKTDISKLNRKQCERQCSIQNEQENSSLSKINQ